MTTIENNYYIVTDSSGNTTFPHLLETLEDAKECLSEIIKFQNIHEYAQDLSWIIMKCNIIQEFDNEILKKEYITRETIGYADSN